MNALTAGANAYTSVSGAISGPPALPAPVVDVAAHETVAKLSEAETVSPADAINIATDAEKITTSWMESIGDFLEVAGQKLSDHVFRANVQDPTPYEVGLLEVRYGYMKQVFQFMDAMREFIHQHPEMKFAEGKGHRFFREWNQLTNIEFSFSRIKKASLTRKDFFRVGFKASHIRNDVDVAVRAINRLVNGNAFLDDAAMSDVHLLGKGYALQNVLNDAVGRILFQDYINAGAYERAIAAGAKPFEPVTEEPAPPLDTAPVVLETTREFVNATLGESLDKEQVCQLLTGDPAVPTVYIAGEDGPAFCPPLDHTRAVTMAILNKTDFFTKAAAIQSGTPIHAEQADYAKRVGEFYFGDSAALLDEALDAYLNRDLPGFGAYVAGLDATTSQDLLRNGPRYSWEKNLPIPEAGPSVARATRTPRDDHFRHPTSSNFNRTLTRVSKAAAVGAAALIPNPEIMTTIANTSTGLRAGGTVVSAALGTVAQELGQIATAAVNSTAQLHNLTQPEIVEVARAVYNVNALITYSLVGAVGVGMGVGAYYYPEYAARVKGKLMALLAYLAQTRLGHIIISALLIVVSLWFIGTDITRVALRSIDAIENVSVQGIHSGENIVNNAIKFVAAPAIVVTGAWLGYATSKGTKINFAPFGGKIAESGGNIDNSTHHNSAAQHPAAIQSPPALPSNQLRLMPGSEDNASASNQVVVYTPPKPEENNHGSAYPTARLMQEAQTVKKELAEAGLHPRGHASQEPKNGKVAVLRNVAVGGISAVFNVLASPFSAVRGMLRSGKDKDLNLALAVLLLELSNRGG